MRTDTKVRELFWVDKIRASKNGKPILELVTEDGRRAYLSPYSIVGFDVFVAMEAETIDTAHEDQFNNWEMVLEGEWRLSSLGKLCGLIFYAEKLISIRKLGGPIVW